MNKTNKTVAVVVTHNRCKLLKRCIEHLQRQTATLDQILVINNASSDGTLELLYEMGVTTITQENLGSAGGWRRGIEYALENGYEAAWLMDDDGYPDENALKLLQAAFTPDKACVSSVVVQEDNPLKFVFPLPILNKRGLPAIWAFPRQLKTISELSSRFSSNTYPFAHLFNGALISMNAAREIGNVNDDYYIAGDEIDYLYRLRQYGDVISVVNSYHYHPDVSKRPYSPTKIYYYTKNTLSLNRKYFDSVYLRNIMAILIIIIRTTRRNGISSIYALLFGKHKNAFYPAIYNGLKGVIKKDFNA